MIHFFQKRETRCDGSRRAPFLSTDRTHKQRGTTLKQFEDLGSIDRMKRMYKIRCQIEHRHHSTIFGEFRKRPPGLQQIDMKSHTQPLTREQADIVARIRQLDLQGFPVRMPAVLKKNLNLVVHATQIWSSWNLALQAAAINDSGVGNLSPGGHCTSQIAEPPEPTWPPRNYESPKDVLDGIHLRHCLDLPLSTHAIGKGPNRDRDLLNAALKHFGTWPAAVKARGIHYDSVKRPERKYSSRSAVLSGLLHRKSVGLSLLSPALVAGSQRNISLYKNALRIFGTWTNALSRAGIKVRGARTPNSGRYKTREAVIAKLQKYHKRGHTLTAASLLTGPHPDPSLVHSARRLFKSWKAAITMAGTLHCRRKYPDRSAIVKALRHRHAARLSLSARQLQTGKSQDRLLYSSLLREFGSIEAARQGAGL